jgi:phosphatidylglycerophosphate synthase
MWFLFPSRRKEKFDFLKPNDAWLFILITSSIVIPVVLLLRRFKDKFPFYMITPNAVTFFSFIFSTLTLILIFLYPDRQTTLAWGFMLAILMDDMDGTLARATGATSDFGALADLFFDLFREGLGLGLIGLALGRAHHCLWIFPLMTFYGLFYGAYMMNNITKIVKNFNKPREKVEVSDVSKTAWERFCDRRGCVYTIFSEYDAFMLIVLSIIFFRNPILPITGIIFFRFLYWPVVAMVSSKSVLKRLQ